jgi:hypothetical protein
VTSRLPGAGRAGSAAALIIMLLAQAALALAGLALPAMAAVAARPTGIEAARVGYPGRLIEHGHHPGGGAVGHARRPAVARHGPVRSSQAMLLAAGAGALLLLRRHLVGHLPRAVPFLASVAVGW